MIDIIKPNWPVPEHVHAYTTTRVGGYSEPPYDSLNMGYDSGDNEEVVATNRMLVRETLDLPSEPFWLNQHHGNKIICVDSFPDTLEADGSFARTPDKVCVVLTADCLPVFMTNPAGTVVAVLHCGWKSQVANIIENGVNILRRFTDELLVWLGPGISAQVYEVGSEFREQFLNKNPENEVAFKPKENDKWLADMYEIARISLRTVGVNAIYGGEYCTYSDPKRFYSYRRDHTTGRMASMIWFAQGI
ncbi:MAG: peptidoglycan editing factor PgeF [Gammaproteobacteria bacterium]